MTGRFAVALVICVAACMTVAMFPLTIGLGKAGWDVESFFMRFVSPRIGIAVVLGLLAIYAFIRRPKLGWAIVCIAPFIAFVAHLALFLVL